MTIKFEVTLSVFIKNEFDIQFRVPYMNVFPLTFKLLRSPPPEVVKF